MNNLAHSNCRNASRPNTEKPAPDGSAFDFLTPDGRLVAFAVAQAALKTGTSVVVGGFLVGCGF